MQELVISIPRDKLETQFAYKSLYIRTNKAPCIKLKCLDAFTDGNQSNLSSVLFCITCKLILIPRNIFYLYSYPCIMVCTLSNNWYTVFYMILYQIILDYYMNISILVDIHHDKLVSFYRYIVLMTM